MHQGKLSGSDVRLKENGLSSLKERGWVDIQRWTMQQVRDMLGRSDKVSCCVGCPKRPQCDTGGNAGYHVLHCEEVIDKEYALSMLSHVHGVPKQLLL